MAASPIAHIQLSHLIPQEGETDPNYVSAVTKLIDALQNEHVCLLKLDAAEAATLKKGLVYASGTLEKQRNLVDSKKLGGEAQLNGDIVGGYHALPDQEIYNVMLGERPHDQALVTSFRMLSDASRRVLRALAWALHVDTHIDQGLLTFVTSDKPGLEVFSKGSWTLVDADLAPDELVLFPGQALTEATAGLITAAEHRIAHVSNADTDVSGPSAVQGRLSAAFKCRPRLDATFDRGPIFAAHTSVGSAYVRDKRLLPVAAYVADMTLRYESVNDVKVKKEDHAGEYGDGASMAAPLDQKLKVEDCKIGPPLAHKVKVEPYEPSAPPNKKTKVEKYNLRARPVASVGDKEKALRIKAREAVTETSRISRRKD
ncbi:hypothetical protein KFL_008570030 [Klebsormidium nitens]|uniref:Fe2OG dioxygenase domain-containing protein n=1 Tax=Klebsormidium nitens TaxID=105231 RepID=A0A1Y1IQQ2_KLENI|nr:hypothetical protein KFL_008570030 [Klebsormidium nitens]|eukprot:GAQ91799.1 hypothetical protein KFL_008570030 [Klebsormidium nitens]